jgi:hypothetical protein
VIDRIKVISILAMLIVVWPLCVAVWVIQWPFVRYMGPAAHSPSPLNPTALTRSLTSKSSFRT